MAIVHAGFHEASNHISTILQLFPCGIYIIYYFRALKALTHTDTYKAHRNVSVANI